MTRKLLLSLSIIILTANISFAQKFAYVDTDYILEQIPEYKEAQKSLDDLSINWQKQIEAKYTEIDKLYKAYQAEQILLTEDMKSQRENEIVRKEKEVKDFQKNKFGVEGELFKKRQELIQPIQDQIYNAIQTIAEDGSYSMILDRAGNSSNILYANSRYDKSKAVLKKLGY